MRGRREQRRESNPTTHLRFVVNTLGKPKVRETDVTAVVNQHVFRLEISENNVEIVKILKGEHRLRREKFGLHDGGAVAHESVQQIVLLGLDMESRVCDGWQR
jgi:hypothetical protein